MADKMSDVQAEAAKMIGDLLSMLLPNCDFVLVAKPESLDNAFAITNLEPKYSLVLAEAFVKQSKHWSETSPDKPD